MAATVPFILLYATAGLGMYRIGTRLLRDGRDRHALLCMLAYALLPWPMIALALY